MDRDSVFIMFDKIASTLSNISTIAPFLLIAGGIGCVLFTARIASKHKNTIYRRIEAEILSSELGSRMSPDADTTFWPKIEYRYLYNNAEYTSFQVFASVKNYGTNDRFGMEGIVSKYPADSIATAYVSETDPTIAYLEELPRGSFAIFYIAGIGLTAIGLFLVL